MAETNEGKKREVRITGVPAVTKEELTSIAAKIGVSTSDFLKTKLKDIALSYPEDYRNYTPPED